MAVQNPHIICMLCYKQYEYVGTFSVVDPDPGSGTGWFRIPDLGSQTHIFENLVTIFSVKSSVLLFLVNQFNFFSLPVQK
jgi:hypothetical protein